MTKAFNIIVFLLSLSFQSYGQVKDIQAVRVLRLNHIGKDYKYNNTDKTVTHLKYLGIVHTNNDTTYKILTSVWLWGVSHRATSRILIYSDRNKYLGNYPLTTVNDLPSYIENNMLVFTNKPGDCDTNQVTRIDFTNGLPKDFFRKCKGESGDVYTFEKG